MSDLFEHLQARPPAINIAAYATHNNIRREIMGEDYRRAASEAEVAQMENLLERELTSGALGLSTGLE